MQAASPTSLRAKRTVLPRHCPRGSATYLVERASSTRLAVRHGQQQWRAVKRHELPAPRPMRLLILAGVPRAPVVMVKDGGARVVVRRETYEDLLARDVEHA